MKPAIFSLFLPLFLLSALSCDDSGGSVATDKKALLMRVWKVAEGSINGFPQSVTPSGFGAIRATFTDGRYVYRFPAYGEQAAQYGVTPGTAVDEIGSWVFSTDETRILLTPDLTPDTTLDWKILQLTFGNLQTEYQALNPITGGTATYVIKYTLAE